MGLLDWLKAKPKSVPSLRLTVFCLEELLPCPLQIVHPDELLGAFTGTPEVLDGKVLDGQVNSVLALRSAMEKGSYRFSSLAGTVVARVSRRRKGDPYPGSNPVPGMVYQGLGSVERGWLANSLWEVDLEISSVGAGAMEAVQFLVNVADRMGALAGGVVLDGASLRYYFPGMRNSPETAQAV